MLIKEYTMDLITRKAYAKINLALDVIGKRDNGYHDVRMIMQSIKLYDKITIKPTQNPEIIIKTNLHYLPTNENNIVYAAAKLFRETYDIQDGFYITLEKKIPVAAGMAGGSSDAAATLKALNQLYDMNLSIEELMKLSVSLGADVPYCLMYGTALSEGIGEILTPLRPAPNFHCLIVKPPVSVSTKYVYENLDLSQRTQAPDIDGMVEAIHDHDSEGIVRRLSNVLETVTLKAHPEIEEIKKEMLKQGALNCLMSGSGPTVFGLFDDITAAEKAFYAFKVGPYGKQTFLTQFYQPE